MKIALVGAELEENLALRCIHAAASKAGHEARIFDFHERAQTAAVARKLAEFAPDLVGLSMVFTIRAREFMDLAVALRSAGFRGHVTSGGHFATLHAETLLRECPAIDSVLHGEGEEAIVDLAASLDRPHDVLGITCRRADGALVTTSPRPAPDDLDSRPRPTRPESFDSYLGRPIANILSGRGCYAHCNFCSINAWHRRIGGKRFRQRSVEALTSEMASLYHDRGVRLFNFHDDNFFLLDRARSLERFEGIRRGLDRLGVGRIGIQIKARPDSVDAGTVDALREIGLFRVFLGVESNAERGLEALGRGIRREQNRKALRILIRAGLHVTFNLLMFEPDCSPGDLRDNIDFICAHEGVPLNFCRVEVYGGTEIERRLRAEGRLTGDVFGWTYRIADPRSQLAYEIFREVFTPRNFDLSGMNPRAMSVDYHLQVLMHFHPEGVTSRLARAAKGFVRSVNRSNVDLLGRIVDFAEGLPDAEAARRFAEELSAERERFDADARARSAAVLKEIRDRALILRLGGKTRRLTSARAAAAAAILAGALGATGCPHPTEMAPPDNASGANATPGKKPAAGALRPYTADETADVQKYLQSHYGFVLQLVATDHLESEKMVPVYFEFDGSGKVTRCDVKLSASEYAQLIDALKSRAVLWRLSNAPHAGSCTVTLKLTPVKTTTHIFEMAPVSPQGK